MAERRAIYPRFGYFNPELLVKSDDKHNGCACCTSDKQEIDLSARYKMDMTPCWVCRDCAGEIDDERLTLHQRRKYARYEEEELMAVGR